MVYYSLTVFFASRDYRLAIVGGTYKVDDYYAAQAGIGYRGQQGGFCVALSPHKREMMLFNDLFSAQKYFMALKELD